MRCARWQYKNSCCNITPTLWYAVYVLAITILYCVLLAMSDLGFAALYYLIMILDGLFNLLTVKPTFSIAAHPWLRNDSRPIPLDILIYKLVKSYLHATPFKRAALKVLFLAFPYTCMSDIFFPSFSFISFSYQYVNLRVTRFPYQPYVHCKLYHVSQIVELMHTSSPKSAIPMYCVNSSLLNKEIFG